MKLDLVQPGVSNELRCIIFLFPVETETVTCTWQPPVKPRVLIGPEKKKKRSQLSRLSIVSRFERISVETEQ